MSRKGYPRVQKVDLSRTEALLDTIIAELKTIIQQNYTIDADLKQLCRMMMD
ncbi:hypothetical protein KAR91_58585 [Candidatus Pacearchaeota archaeon]|nr:hypothetical protein [Candidatus Pacearchaeota archaeon]